MKRAYLLIHDERCSIHTQFLRVWIGQTQQDKDKLRLFSDLAATFPHYYFKLWSVDVEEFLWKIAESLNVPLRQLAITNINAREAARIMPAADVKNLSNFPK